MSKTNNDCFFQIDVLNYKELQLSECLVKAFVFNIEIALGSSLCFVLGAK